MMSACVGAPEPGDGLGQDEGTDVAPTGKGIGTVDKGGPEGYAKPVGQAGSATIAYHNGPIMTGATNVYLIWYGNWSGNSATTIIPAFVNGLSGSPLYNINTSYYNSSSTHITNSVKLAGQTTVAYPYGTALTDANIQSIVADAINSAALPKDAAHGVYFVLTSKDVNETSGLCSQYCGWHTNGTIAGSDIKYSIVGDAARCITSCSAQSTGPNGNAGADGMASILYHELSETVTDPDLNAWYDSQGYENGDKCAWTFGTTSTAANGSKYNVTLGGKQYLIQQNWVATAGGCKMSY